MYNLNDVAKECMKELDAINIPYGKILSVTPNTRSLNRWGQCKRVQGGYTINISQYLINAESKDGLKNTIIHELLHTCPGCMNHKTEWKAMAEKVNNFYGYNITRVSDANSKNLTNNEQEQRKQAYIEKKQNRKQYVIQCQDCGQKYVHYRKCRVVENPENFLCGKCRGVLKLVEEWN